MLLLAEVVVVLLSPRLAVEFDDVLDPTVVLAVEAGVEEAVCAVERDRTESKAEIRKQKVLILTA